ncbi:MAG: hypothetical protein P1U58_09525 [Verrucomicrobiales bacterium]|nr:hypothetical protein [Verrucomicrobiales bacterium]
MIRFLDERKNDIIPRKDRVWTVEALASRMAEALATADRPVPLYLKALAGVAAAKEPAQVAFAMHCFWTGEFRIGGLEGVLTTEAGWLNGREVTRVTWDRSVLGFEQLLEHAANFECADKVFVSVEGDRMAASSRRLSVGTLDESYRRAKLTDQKRQISGTPFERLNLSPVQATKINALARINPKSALNWLTPLQRSDITNS